MLLRLAPLIHECHANFECRLYDDALEDKYNFFVFEVVKAHVAASTKHLQTIHYNTLHRRWYVHGLRQDHQPKVTVPAGDVVN
jgi:flavin reductase (DIM6/NTAB) family NADH-FMN oxidoreductase RutF